MRCDLRFYPSFVLFGLSLVVFTATAHADIQEFNALEPSDNTTTRNSWLAAVGISSPANLVDFESGFVDGQNISGMMGLFPAGLVINDSGTGDAEAAIIRTGGGVINGSNPVGTFSVTHDEAPFLELDFSASPVDYVAFQDIDTTGTVGIATLIGGETIPLELDTTGGGGDSAEFFGLFRNDKPRITLVQLDASGDGRWGIDTIEYGILVPEPQTSVLMLLIATSLLLRRVGVKLRR